MFLALPLTMRSTLYTIYNPTAIRECRFPFKISSAFFTHQQSDPSRFCLSFPLPAECTLLVVQKDLDAVVVVVVVCRPVVFSSRFWMHPPACSFSFCCLSFSPRKNVRKKKRKRNFFCWSLMKHSKKKKTVSLLTPNNNLVCHGARA